MKNEAKQAFQDSKSIYKEYTEGMTRERLGREFHADSTRLKELYQEAIGSELDPVSGEPIPFLTRVKRLIVALSIRMSPTRRLIFAVSLFLFFSHYFLTGILPFSLIAPLMLPFAFGGLVMLLLTELLEKLDVKKEMDLARDIQLGLLPAPVITGKTITINSFASTASEVGGDYVDVIQTPKGTYYIIADVSGKGLSAALYMLRVQAMVHLLVHKVNPTPKELFLTLNDYIKSGRDDKTFVTACAAYFPNDEHHFYFVRAGHNAPILYKADTEAVLDLKTTGFALGMTSTKRLGMFMKEAKIKFEKNDSILFYTDGLNEARNEQGDEFGDSRIRSFMEIYGSLDPKTIIHKLHASIEQFIGTEKPADDITFSCIKKNN